MNDPVEAAVAAANRDFYAAFRARDVTTMLSLWVSRGPVSCVHPGWPPMTERRQILKSWAEILSNPGSPRVSCGSETVQVLGPGIATVLAVEVIGGQALAATNVFLLEDGQWRIAHHQAGPMAGHFDPDDEDGPEDDDLLDEGPDGAVIH